MQSRQPRLGDILDDYCPRERRVTNHAVVAMVGADVKQTRCTTCDADHEYKHAKVPRHRRKSDTPAVLYAHVAAGAPKRVVHDDVAAEPESVPSQAESTLSPVLATTADKGRPEDADADNPAADSDNGSMDAEDAAGNPGNPGNEDGPVHRQLIRATLPRTEGQPPPQRPAPDFTIRQPAGRPGRFRPRPQQGGGQSFGNTGRPNSSNSGSVRGGARNQSHQGHQGHQGPHGQQGRPQGGTAFRADRQGSGRRRSK
jgi:hypothetical protein